MIELAETISESFDWILLNSKFICVIDTVTTYLGKWGKRVNFSNSVAEIQQKYEREREKVRERKFWILVMWLPKFLLPEPEKKKIVAIVTMSLSKTGGKKNSGCRNLGRKKKCYVHNIFTTFSQQITGD